MSKKPHLMGNEDNEADPEWLLDDCEILDDNFDFGSHVLPTLKEE